MSIATKRKHVMRAIQDELILPHENQFIAKVLSGRGNNLHEVETASGNKFLASMPTKFRKNVWIKRGDYVLCEEIAEGEKVRAEIIHVLYKDNICYIQKAGLWPEVFQLAVESGGASMSHGSKSGASNDSYADIMPPSSSSADASSSDENSDTDHVSSAKMPYKTATIRNPNRGRLFNCPKTVSGSTKPRHTGNNAKVDMSENGSSSSSIEDESADEADSEDNADDDKEGTADRSDPEAGATGQSNGHMEPGHL